LVVSFSRKFWWRFSDGFRWLVLVAMGFGGFSSEFWRWFSDGLYWWASDGLWGSSRLKYLVLVVVGLSGEEEVEGKKKKR
jgi:hypothetical protein